MHTPRVGQLASRALEVPFLNGIWERSAAVLLVNMQGLCAFKGRCRPLHFPLHILQNLAANRPFLVLRSTFLKSLPHFVPHKPVSPAEVVKITPFLLSPSVHLAPSQGKLTRTELTLWTVALLFTLINSSSAPALCPIPTSSGPSLWYHWRAGVWVEALTKGSPAFVHCQFRLERPRLVPIRGLDKTAAWCLLPRVKCVDLGEH